MNILVEFLQKQTYCNLIGKEHAFSGKEVLVTMGLEEVILKQLWDLQKEVANNFLGEVFPYIACAYAFLNSCGTEDVFVVMVLLCKDFFLVYGFILVYALNIFMDIGNVPSSFAQVETMC